MRIVLTDTEVEALVREAYAKLLPGWSIGAVDVDNSVSFHADPPSTVQVNLPPGEYDFKFGEAISSAPTTEVVPLPEGKPWSPDNTDDIPF